MTSFLCDVNVWLAFTISGHSHHRSVASWFDGIDESQSILFCRATQQSYLRLLTNAAVHAPFGDPPLTSDEAWSRYDALLADDRIVERFEEPHGLERFWRDFTNRQSASPKLWMDAYLAAFAKAAGYRMVTTDRAFRQFAGLDLLILGDGG